MRSGEGRDEAVTARSPPRDADRDGVDVMEPLRSGAALELHFGATDTGGFAIPRADQNGQGKHAGPSPSIMDRAASPSSGLQSAGAVSTALRLTCGASRSCEVTAVTPEDAADGWAAAAWAASKCCFTL
jgi:hypothetical protein